MEKNKVAAIWSALVGLALLVIFLLGFAHLPLPLMD
jgi:hypothetical protein